MDTKDVCEVVVSIERVLDEACQGRMFILVDDETPDSEGHLVLPAQFATPDAINFMAKHARGLVRLALTKERIEALTLPALPARNDPRHDFTVSIEARTGVSTGISAADRARTIQVAIDASKTAEDIVTPGHVFPLCARNGGVLVRAGFPEAIVDIARLAGLTSAGVLCQVMAEDGAMAKIDQLKEFARAHSVKIATIRDLIAYRRHNEVLIDCVAREQIVSEHGGEWQLRVYKSRLSGTEHLAMVKGQCSTDAPTLVRMHVFSMYDDILGEQGGRANLIRAAMELIGKEGAGVFVLIRNFDSIDFTEMFQSARNQPESMMHQTQREYGVGAQILLDLGISKIELMSNAVQQTIVGLDGYGLEIVNVRSFANASRAD